MTRNHDEADFVGRFVFPWRHKAAAKKLERLSNTLISEVSLRFDGGKTRVILCLPVTESSFDADEASDTLAEHPALEDNFDMWVTTQDTERYYFFGRSDAELSRAFSRVCLEGLRRPDGYLLVTTADRKIINQRQPLDAT